MRIRLIIYSLFISSFLIAHNQTADSLKLLVKTSSKTDLPKLYNQLAKEYLEFDIDISKEYSSKALSYSIRYKDTAQELIALMSLADYYFQIKNYNEAFELYFDVIDRSDESVKQKIIAKAYYSIGNIFLNIANYNQALSYYLKSQSIIKEDNNSALYANNLNKIGVIHALIFEFDVAEKYFNSSLAIHLKNKNWSKVAGEYNNLGKISKLQGKYDLAILYYNQAIEHCLPTSAGDSFAYYNLLLFECIIYG